MAASKVLLLLAAVLALGAPQGADATWWKVKKFTAVPQYQYQSKLFAPKEVQAAPQRAAEVPAAVQRAVEVVVPAPAPEVRRPVAAVSAVREQVAAAPAAKVAAAPAAKVAAAPTAKAAAAATGKAAAGKAATATAVRARAAPAGEAAAAAAAAPAFDTVAAAVAATPELSTLLAAAQAAGLAATLADPALRVTVLAPTDAAFAAALARLGVTAEALLAQPALLREVLSYHVVPEVIFASGFTDGQTLTTLGGGTLTVALEGGRVCFVPSAPGAPRACVVQADVAAGESVVHVIDNVLIPAGAGVSRGAARAPAAEAATARTAPTAAARPTARTAGALYSEEGGN